MHIVRGKSKMKLDDVAVILIKIFQDMLAEMFEGGIVRITSTPRDPIWRIQYVSRRTCGYVLIHQYQDKISLRIYGSTQKKELPVPFKDWRHVIHEIAVWGLLSYDETARRIDEYTRPISALPGAS